ncbi:MAG: NAD(P)-binding domain-containing protein, partial [Vicingaceae bacterium]
METKIAIIGAGNLGLSLVTGLVDSGIYSPSNFILSRRDLSKLEDYKSKGFTVTSDNIEAVKSANIVIFAVLPQKIDVVLAEIATVLNANQLVIP